MERLTDILAEAREQVLERGEGLTQDQVLTVLQLPDDQLDELLALRPRRADALVRS